MTNWNDVPVSEDHAGFLAEQGITPGAAQQHGIRTIRSVEELPEEFHGQLRNAGERAYPSLLFPWVETDGTVRNQIKLPPELAKDFKAKYLFARGASIKLGQIRKTPSERALIVEGTKQSLVAGIYAPEEFSVYGISGCRGWSEDGIPTPYLAALEGKKVTVLLDADAASNRDVYDAGIKLKEALEMFGATEVRFARIPGGKTVGLDDLLGRQNESGRSGMLKRIIDACDKMTKSKASKPADSRPDAKKSGPTDLPEYSDDGRYHVVVNGDARDEFTGIIAGVKYKWDGRKVFNFGGAITRLKHGETIPQSKGMWKATATEACRILTVNQKGEYVSTHPSSYAIEASYSRGEDFTPLDGVKHAPFVRRDGTICTESGYDKESRMYLYPSEDLKDLSIPDSPSTKQVNNAREVIEDWLHDFRKNVPTDADRANMVALAITPFIRLLLPSCPLAVINGLQMGVGKNLLADGISIVYNGERMEPVSLVLDDEEQRKQLTSTFQRGGDFFLFDEAHTVSGKELARALTAPTWVDRILGSNNTVKVPNNATWIALGNNVRVEGDLQRRVYPINLRPNTPNPQNRTEKDFRHPDFRAYTSKNRRKILVAILTIIRAWFDAGQPVPEKSTSFGSFETFEKVIGGILENSGIHGFLNNRMEFATESSYEIGHWEQHLGWLSDTFDSEQFTTKQVREKLLEDAANSETPPGLEDPSPKNYTRSLGIAYGRMNERFIGRYRLVKSGTKSNATRWVVEVTDEFNDGSDPKPPKGDGGNGGGGNTPTPDSPPSTDGGYAMPFDPEYGEVSVDEINVFDVLGGISKDPTPVEDDDMKPTGKVYQDIDEMFRDLDDPFAESEEDKEIRAEVAEFNDLVWDIETGSSDDLFKSETGSFLTLSGYQGDDGDHEITESGDEITEVVEKSHRNWGFNHIGFDIPALARHHGGDFIKLTEGARDLMLIERQVNPTDAKGVKPGYYGLDQTAKRYGHEGKTDDLNKLKNKYGGYDQIPRDVLEPYLHGDLEATAFLKDKIGHHYDEDPYIPREHEVMRRVNYGPRMNGFRVDLDELQNRLKQGEDRKESNLQRLHSEFGMPLGKYTEFKRRANTFERFKSPLASKPGKEWLEQVFKDLGATRMRRTEKSKDLSTNKDDLRAAIEFYSDAAKLRKAGMDPSKVDIDRLTTLIELIIAVTGERTVYQTIEAHRVGDRVHPSVSPDQASGRWSVKNPGLTVLGKRGGKHVERGVLLADEGQVLVAIDLDQVDARAIAAHSGDRNYMKLFEPGMDLHSTNAELAFGRSDGEWRDRAKILGHGFNYGMGPKGASAQTGMPLEIAERFHQMMSETYPRLEEWKNEIRDIAGAGMLLDNGFGRKMKCNPDRAYTQAPALVGQGATRDIIAQGILNLDMDLVACMKVIVHDEIVFSLPEDTWESDVERILDAMQFEIQFNDNPPMQITAGVSKPGKNWSDVYAK